MGKAIMLVSPELLACALHLPENAKIIAIKDEIDWHRWIELLIESDDISEHHSGEPIKVTPTYHRISNVVTDRIEFTWDSGGFIEPEKYADKVRFSTDSKRFVVGSYFSDGYQAYENTHRDEDGAVLGPHGDRGYHHYGWIDESSVQPFLDGKEVPVLC